MKSRSRIKRVMALVLALAMVLSLGAGAMAVGERSGGAGGKKNDRHEVIHDRDDRGDRGDRDDRGDHGDHGDHDDRDDHGDRDDRGDHDNRNDHDDRDDRDERDDRDDREDVYHTSDDAYYVAGDVYEVGDDVRIYEENVAAIRGAGIVFGDEGDSGDVISWVETAQLAVCLERVVAGREPYKTEMHGNRYCTRSLRDKLLSEPPPDPYAGVARMDAAMIFAAVRVPGGVGEGVLSADGVLLRREAAAIAANILRLAAQSGAGVVQNE